jgi:RNA recognition motif-containing protein
MNLFVAGLPFDVDDQEFKEIFEEYGTVTSAKVIMDRETGKSRGFGFVDMADNAEAENVIKRLHGADLDGRTLTVKVAEEKKKNTNGPRRNFRDGNNRERNRH